MKLKCIGGPCDGDFHSVDNNFRSGDLTRVPAKIEFNIGSFEEELTAFREGRTPKNFSIPYYMYKLSTLHFSDRGNDILKFLIPVEWSDREAVIYQFGK
jgi:hypothetical protein